VERRAPVTFAQKAAPRLIAGIDIMNLRRCAQCSLKPAGAENLFFSLRAISPPATATLYFSLECKPDLKSPWGVVLVKAAAVNFM
jgi:hypothetical protein